MMLGILRKNKEDSPSPTCHCREYSKTHALRHADAYSRAIQSVQGRDALRLYGRDGDQMDVFGDTDRAHASGAS